MDIFEALDMKPEDTEREWDKVSGFIKIGRVFTFKPLNHKRNSVGDWEPIKFLQMMSDKEPNTKFVILSGCDFDKVDPQRIRDLFPNENVFYYGQNREEYKDEAKAYMRIWSQEATRECQDVYCLTGPCGTRNGNHDFGPNFKYICMNLNYVAPSYHWLNNMDIPQIWLCTDDRYLPHGFDLYKTPKVVMGQFGNPEAHYQCYHKRIEGADDPNTDAKLMEKYWYDVVNCPLESLWLYNRERPKPNMEGRSDDLLIVANQVASGDLLNDRFNGIKKFIIDQGIGASLVGKWTSTAAQEIFKDILLHPDGVNADDLYGKILPSHKYGVIFEYNPGYGKYRGWKESNDIWIVCKVWEYIYYGVIPIIVGYQGPYRSLPPQLMVKTPEQLKETVAWLDSLSNESKEAIIDRLLKDEYLNGEAVYNRIKEVRAQYDLEI